MIGLFGKDVHGDIFYMPAPAFLEAGKFKLQRGAGSLCAKLGLDEANLAESYAAKYAQKLEVSEMILFSVTETVDYRVCPRDNWCCFRLGLCRSSPAQARSR